MSETRTDEIGVPWMSHADYERRFPRAARYRAAMQGESFGPCEGMLHFFDTDSPTWTVECDRCPPGAFRTSVRRTEVDPVSLTHEQLAKAGLPAQYVDKPFEQTEGTEAARLLLRRWIEHFSDVGRPKAPALVGDPGRGKTHLLTQTAVYLIRKHLTVVRYTTMPELIEVARDAIKGDRSRYAHFERCTLLILDDVGAERATDFAVDKLQLMVDHRYRMGMPVLIATNVLPSFWPDYFGSRTASRLAEMTEAVNVEGPDWRQK